MDFSKGDATNERFRELVPGASHTYSKGEDQFPLRSPKLMARAHPHLDLHGILPRTSISP